MYEELIIILNYQLKVRQNNKLIFLWDMLNDSEVHPILSTLLFPALLITPSVLC